MTKRSLLVPAPVPAARAASKTAAGENFPVGSWLLPAGLRPVVAAFYRLARAADDIADHPGLDPATKIARLLALDAALTGSAGGDPAAPLAIDLKRQFDERGLSIANPRHLLAAFRADAANRGCRTWSDLLAYCRYSAAPVGRFLLELHGEDGEAKPASDALCAALQIVNHLQDCQADYRDLRRLYIPLDWLRAAGLDPEALLEPQASLALRAVLDRVLAGIDRLNQAAGTLPRLIKNRGLRMEAAAILDISRRLARKLRRRDPLAGRVALSRREKLTAVAVGVVRGWRR
ncbi:MAG: squalene/phytoene synthase family protein [Pseudomonadota bacterium]